MPLRVVILIETQKFSKIIHLILRVQRGEIYELVFLGLQDAHENYFSIEYEPLQVNLC